MVLAALGNHVTLDNQKEQKSDPAWNKCALAAKFLRIDEDNKQIGPELAQHLVDELNLNIVKLHLWNHLSDHIRQLANLLNVRSEPAQNGMMDCNQTYQQSNCQNAPGTILRTTPQREVFHYRELNAIAAKHHRFNNMALTKMLIKRKMETSRPEILTLDDLAEWCAMPKSGATELQCLVFQDIC
jgi:hypothetical protein